MFSCRSGELLWFPLWQLFVVAAVGGSVCKMYTSFMAMYSAVQFHVIRHGVLRLNARLHFIAAQLGSDCITMSKPLIQYFSSI